MQQIITWADYRTFPSYIIRTACDTVCHFYFYKMFPSTSYWNFVMYVLVQTGKRYDHKKQEVAKNKFEYTWLALSKQHVRLPIFNF